MSNYSKINQCRICGNSNLISILNLGNQVLTGVFPKNKEDQITSGPLELVKCQEDNKNHSCGLVQLAHSYDLDEMYGSNYGYRSGLNHSMVKHLQSKVKKILKQITLSPEDLVIDIGSNDSTLLQAYPHDLTLLGIDPTAEKFKKYYPKHIHLIPDYFPSKKLIECFGDKKAKIITSISMFYDLEDPMEFMRQIFLRLDNDGVWVFEQSYLPTMLEMNAYDTVCHEHIEYYRLKQIKWMTDRVGFKIIDIELNSINGGSFSVMVAKQGSIYPDAVKKVDHLLQKEYQKGLDTEKPYTEFSNQVHDHRDELLLFFKKCKKENKKIFGYGASTKGNVILQFCQLTEDDIPYIAEVNCDKFGCYTPGTGIPIISEDETRKMNPDYFLILPWHFKENILSREQNFLKNGGQLIVPLPHIELFGTNNTK